MSKSKLKILFNIGSLLFFSILFSNQSHAISCPQGQIVNCKIKSPICPPEHQYCMASPNSDSDESGSQVRADEASVAPAAAVAEPQGPVAPAAAIAASDSEQNLTEEQKCEKAGGLFNLGEGKCEKDPPANNTAANNNSGGNPNAELVKKCLEAQDKAKKTCDINKNQPLSSTKTQMDLFTKMLTAKAGQMSAAGICNELGSISQAANLAMATMKLDCSGEVSDCDTACNEVLSKLETKEKAKPMSGKDIAAERKAAEELSAKYKELDANCAWKSAETGSKLKRGRVSEGSGDDDGCVPLVSDGTPTGDIASVKSAIRVCKMQNARIQDFETNALAGLTMGNSGNCQDLVNNFASGTDLTGGACATDPNGALCLCLKDPTKCTDFNMPIQMPSTDLPSVAGGGAGSGIGGGTDSDRSLSLASLLNGSGTEEAQGPDLGNNGNRGGDGAGKMFGGSAGGAPGGGGGGAPNKGNGGKGLLDRAKDAIAGFFGGGTANFGSPGGGFGNSQSKKGSGGPNGDKVDLKNFMPGGKFDPKRGLAAVGADGITGPATDNFKKMNQQLSSQETGKKLIP